MGSTPFGTEKKMKMLWKWPPSFATAGEPQVADHCAIECFTIRNPPELKGNVYLHIHHFFYCSNVSKVKKIKATLHASNICKQLCTLQVFMKNLLLVCVYSSYKDLCVSMATDHKQLLCSPILQSHSPPSFLSYSVTYIG